jgi:hypothetical protein
MSDLPIKKLLRSPMTWLCCHSGKAEIQLQSTGKLGTRSSPTRPAALTPRNTWYSLYRRLVESRGRSGRERKNSPPHGPDPRTVQPVASRSTLSRPPQKLTWLKYAYGNYCRFDWSRHRLHCEAELNVRQNTAGKKNPAEMLQSSNRKIPTSE